MKLSLYGLYKSTEESYLGLEEISSRSNKSDLSFTRDCECEVSEDDENVYFNIVWGYNIYNVNENRIYRFTSNINYTVKEPETEIKPNELLLIIDNSYKKSEDIFSRRLKEYTDKVVPPFDFQDEEDEHLDTMKKIAQRSLVSLLDFLYINKQN